MTPAPSPGSTAGHPSGLRGAPRPPNDPAPRSDRPETSAPSPDAVRTALRALATGAPSSPRPAFRETVAEAEAATASALDAAAFLRAGRLPELARAVADAEAAARRDEFEGEAQTAAAAGRRALSTLRRLDSAVGRAFGSDGEDTGDHFRSGHDIVLPRTDQSADR
ncbi:hypothetical protein NDI76_05370 [Halogeometricum sp. S1BR25-6]|uniref:Uncharacterized protein n=1 Tax=Halogeometricum salsisoli TaxID=2950536 RepID=A0ABU2GDB2_9EURY|nr:hypothetical protein [Halogeometricum sp. S1BR25-6]MDS0298164.1 hypothetical protein [Halogeometricum sp. S1BR25-6]